MSGLSPGAQPPQAVVLVHGLWHSGAALALWARRLRRAGFVVHTFSYPSRRGGFRAAADRLDRFLRGLDAPAVHLVGHSLGGLVIRALHHYHPRQHPGRIVTTATPHQGSRAAANLLRHPLGRWLAGQTVAELAAGAPRDWDAPGGEIGVIHGQRSFGLGRLVARLPRPNDGLLSAAESGLPGARDEIALPVSHSGMLLSAAVADQIGHFLRHGRFVHSL